MWKAPRYIQSNEIDSAEEARLNAIKQPAEAEASRVDAEQKALEAEAARVKAEEVLQRQRLPG